MSAQDRSQEKQGPQIRRRSEQSPQEPQSEPHPLLKLQRQIGNAQVSRMIQLERDALLQREEDELQEMRDPALLQREEDELQEMRDPALLQREEDELQEMRDPALLQREEDELQEMRDPALLQREEDELQEMRDPALLQREEDELQMDRDMPEVGLEGGPVSDQTASRIQAQRGKGSPLGDTVRGQMEGAFGTSFEDVRLHTDSESQSLNRSLSAKAFTTGSDIFFGPNGNPGDTGLLSHELTHVVQQRSGGGGGGGMYATPAGDHGEQEAEAMSAKVTSGAAQRTEETSTD